MELKIRVIIEILGAPKEHVREVMGQVVEELKKRDIEIFKREISEPEQVEKFYSIFSEIEFKCKEWNTLVDICFDFLPSVVEIMEPEEVRLEAKKMEDFLNDLLAKLHKQSMITRNLHAENVMMKKQLGVKDGKKSSKM